MSTALRLFISALALTAPLALAQAAPCTNMEWASSLSDILATPAAIAQQLRKTQPAIRTVKIGRGYQAGEWIIMSAHPDGAEDVFLIYRGSPARSDYVTLWGGAAAPAEEAEIRTWVVKNAPGIPAALAGCFAWFVTMGRG